MKRLVTAMLILVGSQGTVADAIVEHTRESLNEWQPKAVVRADSRLRVTTKERRMTAETYRAMLENICSGLGSQPDALAGITEIQIVNKFNNQGFVFAGGEQQCIEISQQPKSEVEAFIRDASHSF